jgi:hypothetical protein
VEDGDGQDGPHAQVVDQPQELRPEEVGQPAEDHARRLGAADAIEREAGDRLDQQEAEQGQVRRGSQLVVAQYLGQLAPQEGVVTRLAEELGRLVPRRRDEGRPAGESVAHQQPDRPHRPRGQENERGQDVDQPHRGHDAATGRD